MAGRGYSFDIPFRLPSLNEYVLANRSNRYSGAAMKRQYEDGIRMCIRASGLPKITGKVFIVFTWFEKIMRRDPDNISAVGRKFILDALVAEGIIIDDSCKYIDGFRDMFVYGAEKDGVGVSIDVG